MRSTLLPIVLFIFYSYTNAQTPNFVGTEGIAQLSHFTLLVDSGYTLEKILGDTTLPFIVNDSLRPSRTNTYWIRVSATNTSHYDRAYNIKVLPRMDNTLYYFDADTKKWESNRVGLFVPTDHERIKGAMSVTFRGQSSTTLFIKVVLTLPNHLAHPVKPSILLEEKSITDKKETLLNTIWITSLSILLLFFLNNLHIYFKLNDRAVLYILLAQSGGMLYITAFRFFFDTLFFSLPCSMQLLADGTVYFYNLNNLLMHIGVLLVMYGFVQAARYYLSSQKIFPKLDTVIRLGLDFYCIATVVLALINCFWFYLEGYTLLYDNIVIMLLLAVVISTAIMGYVKKLPGAESFLLANLTPLFLVLALAADNVFIGYGSKVFVILPDLAIVSQAAGFSTVIVARIRNMRNSIINKELEVQQLVFSIEEVEFKQRLIGLENEQIYAGMELEKSRNIELQEKLEANQRKLASSTLYILEKNKLLAALKTEIEELARHVPEGRKNNLPSVQSILKSNLYLDTDWEKFKLHFEQVHPHFFGDLLVKHPSLTKNELRLCAYFHINLSAKEIAALLNIDPASVHRAKTRLYKKMAST